MDYILVIEGEGRHEVHFFKDFAFLQEHVLAELDNYMDLDDEFGLDTLDICYRVMYKPILD